MLNYKLNIKYYRIKRRFTLKELSRKLHISQSYLNELENNKYDIKLSVLINISKELDVCLGKLVDSKYIDDNCMKKKITTLKHLKNFNIFKNLSVYKIVVLLLLVLNLFY